MTEPKMTLGQAIDKIVEALEAVDESSRSTVLAAVCAHLKVPQCAGVAGNAHSGALGSVAGPVAGAAAIPGGRGAPTGLTDIRSLKSEKQPKSAKQMACVVGYYLQELAPEADRKTTTSTDDLEKYFKQAGYALPKKLEQILVDAKRSGYFDSAGRGEYRLTAVGYNLVAHNLPSKAVD